MWNVKNIANSIQYVGGTYLDLQNFQFEKKVIPRTRYMNSVNKS